MVSCLWWYLLPCVFTKRVWEANCSFKSPAFLLFLFSLFTKRVLSYARRSLGGVTGKCDVGENDTLGSTIMPLLWNSITPTISSLFTLILTKHICPLCIHPDRHITHHVLYRRKCWPLSILFLCSFLSLIPHRVLTPESKRFATNLHKYRQRSLWQCHPSSGYPSPCSVFWTAVAEPVVHAAPTGLCTCLGHICSVCYTHKLWEENTIKSVMT